MDVSRFQLLSDTRRVLIEEMLPCSTGRRGGRPSASTTGARYVA